MVAAAQGAAAGWRGDAADPDLTTTGRYAMLYGLYTGRAFDSAKWTANRSITERRYYENTRLLVKHVESVVDFYAATVYRGSTRADAIPLEPQTGDETTDAGLVVAIDNLWDAWNFAQFVSLRPRYGALLGDGLTELVDETERRMVYPNWVAPWYVADIDLDYAGNVRAYAVEYEVVQEATTAYGRLTLADRYTYRKEVDGDAFRYYRDGNAWDAHGDGSVVPNPYRFVPAIWDRHEVGLGDRGASAVEGTLAALMELNAFVSQAIDYQRKAFAAPIIVKGRLPGTSRTDAAPTIRLPRLHGSARDPLRDAESMAETQHILSVDKDAGGIEQIQFDLGKSLDMADWIWQRLLGENPEGAFFDKLADMVNATGPAIERALAHPINRCRLARQNYDPQTVKLLQMALSMLGFRLNAGDYGDRGSLHRRYEPWYAFDERAYADGREDFAIDSGRPVIPETATERLAEVLLRESVKTAEGLREAYDGDEEKVQRILAERQGARDAANLVAQRDLNAGRIV